MRKTCLLRPFADPTDPNFKTAQVNYQKIISFLKSISSGSDMSFDNYLKEIGLTEDEYLAALRTSIKDVKVFHQRNPDSVRVNAYNPNILEAWQANCDLQFVTSPYACGLYIVGYISKGQRGMSDLLRHACEEARRDGGSIQNQVRSIGNKFNRHVEISEQEASYLVLQMPLRKSSRGNIFINTSPQEERPFLLKTSSQLEELDDDSEDIQCQNMLSRYTKRPRSHSFLCLADFCSWYEIKRYKRKRKTKINDIKDDLPESDVDDNYDDDPHNETNYLQDSEFKLEDGTVMKKRSKQKIIRYVRYCKEKDRENFYREQLLLFNPWFDEDRILGRSKTYEEAYLEVEDDILCKRQEYEPSIEVSEELDDIEEQMNELEDDAWDEIAPVAQHKERQDMHSNMTEEENDELEKEYDIGMDLGLSGGTDIQEEKIRNRMEDEEYRRLARSLNQEQKEIFYHVLKVAKDTDSQNFIFLSGGAGVGKTRVTKAVYQALIRLYNTSPDSPPEQTSVLLTAPTGKAAYLIKGLTNHSAFGIPANQGLRYKMLSLDKLNTYRYKYSNLKWIIIDEISMCGSNMFNFINQRLQEIVGVKKPFGGVSVIAIGDLFQLSPVKDIWIFSHPNKGYSILTPNVWTENFHLFELTKIMRQLDDLPFAETLNRVREGHHTPEDIKLLKTRVVDDSNCPNNATRIMYRNKHVEAHNTAFYQTSSTAKVEVEATDIVIGDVTAEVAQKIKTKAPKKSGDAMGLGKFFKTAVGLRNEMTVNVDVEDGLVNGAACETKFIQFSSATNKPEIIWVLFDDPEVGSKLRRENKHLYKGNIDPSWTPIKKVAREFTVGRYKCAKIRRSQFPLQLACAKTIHKAEGDTLTPVAVKLPDCRKQHMHYVALSRATSLQNLYILGDFNQSKITISPKVASEMKRLRMKALLQLCFKPLYLFNNDVLKVLFHNCQSLRLHMPDILEDYNVKSSDICMFAETKLCKHDITSTLEIPDFDLFRNDFTEVRTAYGSAIYTKKSLATDISSENCNRIELTVANVYFYEQHIQLISVYIRPNEPVQDIKYALQHLTTKLNPEEPIVIMGDFNIDSMAENSRYAAVCRVLASINCHQVLKESTTNSRTCIDLIFTNLQNCDFVTGVLESYFSYHKPVYICITKKPV